MIYLRKMNNIPLRWIGRFFWRRRCSTSLVCIVCTARLRCRTSFLHSTASLLCSVLPLRSFLGFSPPLLATRSVRLLWRLSGYFEKVTTWDKRRRFQSSSQSKCFRVFWMIKAKLSGLKPHCFFQRSITNYAKHFTRFCCSNSKKAKGTWKVHQY